MAGSQQGLACETGWEHFEHVADVGVRGYGASLAEAFEQAALALTAAICDPALVAPLKTVEIACTAPDREVLLVDWLNAIVFEMSTRRMLFSRFSVEIHDGRLHGQASGEAVDPARHEPAAEIKGATFSELSVARSAAGRWSAQCILDV
jgi:SHS2 domain-containing protein